VVVVVVVVVAVAVAVAAVSAAAAVVVTLNQFTEILLHCLTSKRKCPVVQIRKGDVPGVGF
jgi:hypothetical protein